MGFFHSEDRRPRLHYCRCMRVTHGLSPVSLRTVTGDRAFNVAAYAVACTLQQGLPACMTLQPPLHVCPLMATATTPMSHSVLLTHLP